MISLKNIVRNIFLEFRKKTYFRQVLMSYIIVSCVTFLIFSILLLSKIQQESNKTILNFGWQNIEQAMSFNNLALHDISTYGYQMLNEATTYKLLYSDTYDLTTAIASREIYSRIQNANSMITALDFINFSTGTVLTRAGRMKLDQYYDTNLLDYIDTLKPGLSPIFYQPRESLVGGNHKQTQRVLSLIFYTNRRGALVINLDYDAYAAQINLSGNDENMDLLIINHNNYVMASTLDNQFMMDFSENPMYLEILRQTSDTGSFTWKSEDGSQSVLYRKNTPMGFTYISVVPQNKPYSKSYLFGLTFRYSIVYILVTCLLSLLASMILYHPVRQLKHTVSREELLPVKDNSRQSDFELIESAFQNLIEKYTALKQARQTFEQQKEQKLLHLLLEQSVSASQLKSEDFLTLDNSFEYENYMVFIVNVDTSSYPEAETDTLLTKFLIENVTVELIGEFAAIRSIETVTPRVLFLANFAVSDACQTQEQFRAAAQKMQKFFYLHGKFRIAVGFGTITDALDTISGSYETARIALDTGMLHADDTIVFYEEMNFPPLSNQTYPFAIDNEITAAIKNTDTDALDNSLNRFFDAIQDYNYSQIHRHLSHLDDALRRFEYTNGLDTLYTENDLSSQPKLLTDYKKRFQGRCRHDIQTLSEIKLHSHAKDTLISQVQNLVADNIYSPNLSVIMIAEQVGLSVNYLRNVYKENTGESLSAYITCRKLEIIYELLANTDTSIQEISDQLGFATKNYFFTFFKKHTGITPSQYRNEHKS